MFNDKHYVAVLKGREGEYAALRELSSGVKDWVTPLIEVPPIPWDFDNDEPSKSIDDHLAKVPERVFGAWGRQRPLFVDLLWVPADERLNSGAHPLTFVMDGLRNVGVDAVPVTGPARDADYQKSVAQAVAIDKRGACLRVTGDDLADLGKLAVEVEALQESLGVSTSDLDLLVDLQEVTARNEALVATGMRALLDGLPQLDKWRTLTLAASAFPENLSDVPANSVAPIPRADWSLWLAIRAGNPKRQPSFGDYAITDPEPSPSIDPRFIKMSANLRYTRPDVWLAFRGRNVRTAGYEQFHDLCAALVSRKADFDGRGHCWADTFIDDCAQRKQGPGNATTWRKVGTNHHVTRVVGDLQNL